MSRPKLTPQIAFNLAKALYDASGERDGRLESMIAQDAWEAYLYAKYVLKGQFPEAEPIIAQDARSAFEYAYFVLKAPWPEGEPVIAQDLTYVQLYAKNVLKTPEDCARFRKVQRWVAQS
jgi:hypothetical protein